MREIDFYEIVKVVDTEDTRRWGIANEESVVLGKSYQDGRPPVMTVDKLAAGRAMLREGATITTAAKVIGVSRATLYRHLGEPVS